MRQLSTVGKGNTIFCLIGGRRPKLKAQPPGKVLATTALPAKPQAGVPFSPSIFTAGNIAHETYNGRARIENTNCELKQDYNLGKIASQHFHVNDAIIQCTILLYQLVKSFPETLSGQGRQDFASLRLAQINLQRPRDSPHKCPPGVAQSPQWLP